MGRVLAALLVVAAGMLVALQPPINASLGRSVGAVPAAAINFAVGTVALVALSVVGARGVPPGLGSHPLAWEYVAGGLLGAVFVLTALVTVRVLGATGLTVSVIAGQLLMSALIDRLGLLGVETRPLSMSRLMGLALVAVGALLVVRS